MDLGALHGPRSFLRMEKASLLRAWWFWLLPLACALAACLVTAENLRNAQEPGWADLVDLFRLALYCAWLRPAWKAAAGVRHRMAMLLIRAALVLGLLVNALA
jgi:hypothetical protein